MPAGPAVTEPRSIFLYLANREKCRMQKNTHTRTRGILYMCKHTSRVLGAKNIRAEMKFCIKRGVSETVPTPRSSLRWVILEEDTDRWHVHTLQNSHTTHLSDNSQTEKRRQRGDDRQTSKQTEKQIAWQSSAAGPQSHHSHTHRWDGKTSQRAQTPRHKQREKIEGDKKWADSWEEIWV